MKKSIALWLSLVMLTGALTGCAEQVGPASSTPKTVSHAPQETEKATTRMYTDETGRTVEIPAYPQKIVTVNMAGELVALGIPPVGAADGWLQYMDDDQKAGIESIGGGPVGTLNLEKIAALEPDLIITPNIERVTSPEVLASLEKIAPTVVGPWYGDALKNLKTMGELTGREQEAQDWIDKFNARLDEVKSSLSSVTLKGDTALVIQFYQKTMYTYPPSTFPAIYEYLGLNVASESISNLPTDSAQQTFQLSLEILPEYDPDYIFVTKLSDVDESFIAEIFNNSVWKQLSAVKNGRVYEMESRLSAGDVLSLEWSIDEIEHLMTAQQ